ncbi:MAG: LPD25 domain-containing protein [Oscillospiraceae bacterium]
MGNAENVRELAVSGSASSEDVKGDWENSSEYYKYDGVIEHNSEEASSDETEDAFFTSSEESENNEQISLFDTKEDYKPITITCEWSESSLFQEGKVYTVSEFDSIMAIADKERHDGWRSGIEKYGSQEAWEEEDEESYYRYIGYDKTKFTVNLPNGDTITERQDIGDGYGGVIDFLSQYRTYASVVELLRSTVETEIAELQDRTVSEFIDRAIFSLYENYTIRNAHENSDKQEYILDENMEM